MQELTDCVLKHEGSLHARDMREVLRINYFAFPRLSSLNVYLNYLCMLWEDQPLSITQIC
jgi:hypothetical protein